MTEPHEKKTSGDGLFKLDWETTEIDLAKGRFKHTLKRPDPELILKRDDELQATIPIAKDGSYSMRHLSVGHDEPLRAELMAFARAIKTGTPPAVTGEEGVESLAIAMRCLEGRQPANATPQRGPRLAAG